MDQIDLRIKLLEKQESRENLFDKIWNICPLLIPVLGLFAGILLADSGFMVHRPVLLFAAILLATLLLLNHFLRFKQKTVTSLLIF